MPSPHSRITRVAAAVIIGRDGRVLLAQRPEGKPYAGYWEFPGGKLEPGESPRDALVRELREELGLSVTRAASWITQEYVYPHAHVELNFFRVLGWQGEPHGHDGQAFSWQLPGRFDVAPLLPANTRVLAALSLPVVYGITCAEDLGEDAFLARAQQAFASGLKIAQIREKNWPRARRAAFAERLATLARAHGARLLLNGNDAGLARSTGLAGVHWTAADLAVATDRPRDMIVGASCHAPHEVARAAELDLDYALVAPVRATPTHPTAVPLGWDGFSACIANNRVPVYALGGLTRADLDRAIDSGAHGIALRRGAW